MSTSCGARAVGIEAAAGAAPASNTALPRQFQLVVAASKTLRGIGIDGAMPWRLPSELEYFKQVTMATTKPTKVSSSSSSSSPKFAASSAALGELKDSNDTNKENAVLADGSIVTSTQMKTHASAMLASTGLPAKNAVIMGRKTWDSLPKSVRPLPGRLNVVLSRDGGSAMKVGKEENGEWMICSSLDEALTRLSEAPLAGAIENVFVIGGSQVYAEALGHASCGAVHMTEVDYPDEAKLDTFFPPIDPANFRLYSSGQHEKENGLRFQRLTYTSRALSADDIAGLLPGAAPRHEERQYLDAIRDIIETGVERGDRTGTGTLSKFGIQMRFDLRKTFPLLTTKRVFWRGVAEELLWFISGNTDARALQDKGIHIWDGNASREYLDSIGLTDRDEGDLGPVYGFQWRHFGAEYTNRDANYDGQGVDQLKELIHKIKTKPNDRRLILTAWNPSDIPKMALPPCHMFCQFYVANGELSCQLYQRSGDMGLGVPFNIASYALLTRLIAHVTGLKAGELSHVIGDAHVYLNHVEPLKEQLKRNPRPFPTLDIDSSKDDIDAIVFDDLTIVGYSPDKKIEMKMAV